MSKSLFMGCHLFSEIVTEDLGSVLRCDGSQELRTKQLVTFNYHASESGKSLYR